VEAGQFEESLNICALCKSPALGRDVDVELIHEKYALSLFQKGDFEGSMQHYIAGKSNPVAVLMLYPDLVPVVLQTAYAHLGRLGKPSNAGGVGPSSSSSSGGRGAGAAFLGSGTPSSWGPQRNLSPLVLNRAASALAAFCEHHRPMVKDSISCSLS
jgi:hypothetical protein